jgi:hypothetical protein
VAHRVAVDVRGGVLEALVRVDHLGVEAVAEEVAPAVVALVEATGVTGVESLHPVGELLQPALDDHVEVVAQQDEDDRPPLEETGGIVPEAHPRRAVALVPDDRHLADALRRDEEDPMAR